MNIHALRFFLAVEEKEAGKRAVKVAGKKFYHKNAEILRRFNQNVRYPGFNNSVFVQAKKQRRTAISLLLGISIRMPLLIYG